jgi:hypothetical protein
MALFIGITLALAVGVFGTVVGFDRERSFYATTLIVIGLLYGLFAVIGGSTPALFQELGPCAFFLLLAVVGFKSSPWVLAAGLAGHGIFDFFHGHVITNPGVPVWWPMFCGSYDVTAGAYLTGLILFRRARKITT